MTVRMFGASLVMLGTAAYAQVPAIVVTNVPDYGMPWEATPWLHQSHTNREVSSGSVSVGTFSNAVHSAKQVKIRYYSTQWSSDDQVADYLQGLLTDSGCQVSTAPTWAQAVGIPSIEGSITYDNGTVGRLLIWDWVGCFQDRERRWRYMVFQDYFREHGRRETQKKAQQSGGANSRYAFRFGR